MRTILWLAISACAWGQQPSIVNAQLETRALTGDLEQQVQAGHVDQAAAWFGYAVKAAHRNGENCCWNNGVRSGCSLEEGRSTGVVVSAGGPVLLEGSDAIAVLFRVSNHTVEKVQGYSLACPLDAGGLRFVWLTGVSQEASLSFLRSLVSDGSSRRILDGALFAISEHDSPRALDLLMDLARRDPATHVREQALFWLAQRAGERAAATITNAITNDPDTEVKKKAVFALSQLPKDEGVPRLIEVASTQRNPEVRKQAFFWLGQSHDPRALVFIQQVLTK